MPNEYNSILVIADFLTAELILQRGEYTVYCSSGLTGLSLSGLAWNLSVFYQVQRDWNFLHEVSAGHNPVLEVAQQLGLDVLFQARFSQRSTISSWLGWWSLTCLTESMNSQLCWLSSTIIIKRLSPSLLTIPSQGSRSPYLVNLHNTLLYHNQDIYIQVRLTERCSLDGAQWILSSDGWAWQ